MDWILLCAAGRDSNYFRHPGLPKGGHLSRGTLAWLWGQVSVLVF